MIILAIYHPVVARQVLLIVLVPLPGRFSLSLMPYESCAQALSESLAPIVNNCHAINLVISAALQGVFDALPSQAVHFSMLSLSKGKEVVPSFGTA